MRIDDNPLQVTEALPRTISSEFGGLSTVLKQFSFDYKILSDCKVWYLRELEQNATDANYTQTD